MSETSQVLHVKVEESAKPIRVRYSSPERLAVGDNCLLQLDSGMNFGRVSINEGVLELTEEIRALPTVIRKATLIDRNIADENFIRNKAAHHIASKKIKAHSLPMKLTRTAYAFDRSRITFYFTSESRVDFRELVRELAAEFHTRIEMRQISQRHESSMLGGIGPCGRQLCCSSWLKEFSQISIRMAKDQQLSLNPDGLSGMCGRLKCCLKYEHEQYQELDGKLPKMHACATCSHGCGTVVARNILSQTLVIELDEDPEHPDVPNRRVEVPVTEITSISMR